MFNFFFIHASFHVSYMTLLLSFIASSGHFFILSLLHLFTVSSVHCSRNPFIPSPIQNFIPVVHPFIHYFIHLFYLSSAYSNSIIPSLWEKILRLRAAALGTSGEERLRKPCTLNYSIHPFVLSSVKLSHTSTLPAIISSVHSLFRSHLHV